MSDAAPTIEDLVVAIVRDELEARRGPVPASVETYDSSVQRVDALPLVRLVSGGELVEPPVLRDIPVLWPSGSGWAVTGALQRGDVVWLLPAGADISRWSAHGTARASDADPRAHTLSDLVALPGSRPRVAPLPSSQVATTGVVIAGPEVRLGSATASDPVALDSLVLAELQAIAQALATHTHSGVQPGTGTSGPGSGGYSAPSSVGSSKIKGE